MDPEYITSIDKKKYLMHEIEKRIICVVGEYGNIIHWNEEGIRHYLKLPQCVTNRQEPRLKKEKNLRTAYELLLITEKRDEWKDEIP